MSESSVLSSHGSYLLPHLDHATVSDAMHPGILSCDAETTLTEVARMMTSHHVHCVVVGGTGEGTAPVRGIISDLDLLRAGLTREPPETAAELAQRPVVTVATTSPLRDAAQLMLARETSHIVVVNPQTRRPVGILSTLDVTGVLAWGEM